MKNYFLIIEKLLWLIKIRSHIILTCFGFQFLFFGSLWVHGGTNENNLDAAVNSIQEKVVTGRVIDAESKKGLPAVNVVIKGTFRGTVTNVDGEYSINVSTTSDILVFSMIGYLTQEVVVGELNTINVELRFDVKSLDEVVVIGYGTQKKSDLTGAMSNVKIEEINRGLSATFDQLLQGKVPGVQVVTNTGAPGGATSINIRGSSSISASSEPLYVIDGLPIYNESIASDAAQGLFPNQRTPSRNPLSSINPADIESIDILKDASATAIYGARGANGVILITTKRGRQGKLTVNYDGYLGIQNVMKKLDLLSAEEYMKELNEIIDAGGANEDLRIASIEEGGIDWQDAIYRTDAMVNNHNLSMSGGSEYTSYLISLNHMNQEGIVINSNFERYGARINLDHDIKDKFRLGLNLSTSYTYDDYAPVGQAINERSGVIGSATCYDPTIALREEDGTYTRSKFITMDNPLTIAHGYQSFKSTIRTFGTLYGEYYIIPELSAKINLGTDISSVHRDFYVDRTTIEGKSMGGNASIVKAGAMNYLVEGTVNYNKELGNHSLAVVSGITAQKLVRDNLETQASGFPSDVIFTYNLGLGNPEMFIVGSNKSQSTLMSYLVRANYTFKDRYLFTTSIRADGSSKFGENNKFGYFPSLAIGWKIHEEPFFQPLSNIINTFKIRTSWGKTGNQEIGNYRSLTTFSSGNRDAIPFDEIYTITMVPTRMGNPDLKWETTEQFNIGFDFGFFKQRINGSIDYYEKTTKDMLLILPIPIETGFSSQLRNIGSVFNKGIEMGLNAFILTGGLQWKTSISLTSFKNKVLDLGGVPEMITGAAQVTDPMGLIREGYPLYSYYGYEIIGIWQENDDYGSTIDNVHPGDFKFRDVNRDSTVNADDRVILGDPYPDLIWSIGNTFTYRNFELYFFFDGELGGSIYNTRHAETYYPIEFRRNRLAEPIINRWTPENPSNKYPSHIYPYAQGSKKQINSYTVEDGTYLRLNTIQLSYTFNFQKIPLQSATLYITGQNLFVITDYKGMSPIVNPQGTALRIDYNQYPLSRTFLFGIRLGL